MSVVSLHYVLIKGKHLQNQVVNINWDQKIKTIKEQVYKQTNQPTESEQEKITY